MKLSVAVLIVVLVNVAVAASEQTQEEKMTVGFCQGVCKIKPIAETDSCVDGCVKAMTTGSKFTLIP